jgi:hypothetical protein
VSSLLYKHQGASRANAQPVGGGAGGRAVRRGAGGTGGALPPFDNSSVRPPARSWVGVSSAAPCVDHGELAPSINESRSRDHQRGRVYRAGGVEAAPPRRVLVCQAGTRLRGRPSRQFAAIKLFRSSVDTPTDKISSKVPRQSIRKGA